MHTRCAVPMLTLYIYVECKQQFSHASYYNYMRIPHQRYNDDMVLFTRK